MVYKTYHYMMHLIEDYKYYKNKANKFKILTDILYLHRHITTKTIINNMNNTKNNMIMIKDNSNITNTNNNKTNNIF